MEVYENIPDLITKLNYNDLIKECRRVKSGDEYLKRVEIVALIKKSRFREAVKLCDVDMQFEKAYCYYGLKEYDNARNILLDRNDYKSLNLLAQICYNEGNFDQAIELYNRTKGSQKCTTWMKNVSACSAAAALDGLLADEEKSKIMKKCTYLTTPNCSDYEVAINYSLFHTYLHNWDEAKKFVDIANDVFETYSKDEELSVNEAAVEKFFINLQSFYLHYITGDIVAARNDMNNKILPYIKSYDYYSQSIALCNNLLFMKRRSVHESKRKLGPLETASNNAGGLLVWQKKDIEYNLFVLYYYASYLTACANMIDENKRTHKKFSFVDEMKARYLINSKIESRKEGDNIIKLVEEAYHDDSLESVTYKLVCAQIYKERGDYESLVTILLDLLDKGSEIIILICLVQTLKQLSRFEEAFKHIDNFIRNNIVSGFDNLETLFVEYFTIAIRIGKYKESFNTARKLYWMDKSLLDKFVNYTSSFTEVHELRVAPETLSCCIAQVDDAISKLATSTTTKDDAKPKKKKKRSNKTRKRYLLQNYDPAVTPDPERWLPKYERSTYVPKKKKKTTKNKGPQGTFVSGSTEYATYAMEGDEEQHLKAPNPRRGKPRYKKKAKPHKYIHE